MDLDLAWKKIDTNLSLEDLIAMVRQDYNDIKQAVQEDDIDSINVESLAITIDELEQYVERTRTTKAS